MLNVTAWFFPCPEEEALHAPDGMEGALVHGTIGERWHWSC